MNYINNKSTLDWKAKNMSLDIRNKIIGEILNKKNRKILIAMHNSPDGDAIGSAVALEKALLKLNKKVDIILQNKVSENYSNIIGKNRVNKIIIPPEDKSYDLLILLDCSDPKRTVEGIEYFAKKIITIDHHYGCEPFGDIYLYEYAASTGMIIYKIIKRLTPFNDEIATALYLTIQSDTGSFKNSNTDSKAHECASELLFEGANIQTINEIYDNRSLSLLRLMGYTFTNILFDKDYKIVYLVVKSDQIKMANSTYEEASILIDYIRGVNNANITFLFLESKDYTRIKARSKNIDVSEIMNNFGGGGHKNAAGGQIYSNDAYSAAESVINYTRNYIDSINKKK